MHKLLPLNSLPGPPGRMEPKACLHRQEPRRVHVHIPGRRAPLRDAAQEAEQGDNMVAQQRFTGIKDRHGNIPRGIRPAHHVSEPQVAEGVVGVGAVHAHR